MKLYYTPGACSLSPHIVLREAGLKFDLERVDLASKKLKESGADYLPIKYRAACHSCDGTARRYIQPHSAPMHLRCVRTSVPAKRGSCMTMAFGRCRGAT